MRVIAVKRRNDVEVPAVAVSFDPKVAQPDGSFLYNNNLRSNGILHGFYQQVSLAHGAPNNFRERVTSVLTRVSKWY